MFALLVLSAVSARAADPAAVEITSARPGLEVAQLQGLERVPLCTAPCEIQLEAGAPLLAFGGDGITRAVHPLSLQAGDRVQLHVRPGARGAATASGVLGLVSVGLLVASTVSFATSDNPVPALGMTGTGLVTALVAWPLGGVGKTRITTVRD